MLKRMRKTRLLARLISLLLVVCLCVPFSFAEDSGSGDGGSGSTDPGQQEEPVQPEEPEMITVYQETPVTAVFLSENSSGQDCLQVEWTEVESAEKYLIYRLDPATDKWSKQKTASANSLSWADAAPVSGAINIYKVLAQFTVPEPAPEGVLLKKTITSEDGSKGAAFLSPVTLKSVSRPEKDTLLVKWDGSDQAEVQYADNMLFLNPVTLTVSGNEKTITGLKKSKTYYVRVRSIGTIEEQQASSSWEIGPDALGPRTVTITYLKSASGNKYNLRKIAKQKRLHGYDTPQGGCTDGTYIYQIFSNRINHKCKIAKIKKNNYKLVKVSSALTIGHGNDITYNSKKNALVAVYCGTNKLFVKTVDPVSLKVKKKHTIGIPARLPGVSPSDLRKINAFSSVHYDEETNQYLLKGRNVRTILILNSRFIPIRAVIPVKKDSGITSQTIIKLGGFLLRTQSLYQTKDKNIVNVFDPISGNYVSTMNLKMKGELENIYSLDGKLYGTSFKKDYKTKYKTVKKKVKKKVKVKKKGKWVKVWKKVVKRIKKKYRVLYRQAYTFIINIF